MTAKLLYKKKICKGNFSTFVGSEVIAQYCKTVPLSYNTIEELKRDIYIHSSTVTYLMKIKPNVRSLFHPNRLHQLCQASKFGSLNDLKYHPLPN